jgi:adenosylcobinamide-phosphate synthase
MQEAPIVLVVAMILDDLIGDPWNWIHPVQVIGWVILKYTQLVFRWIKHPRLLWFLGMGLAIALIAVSGLVGWGLVAIANKIHALLGVVVASILLASCFAERSLQKAAEEVLQPLEDGDLVKARSHLSRYVGRDTEDLSEAEILRAIFETVTENAVDGVLSPLFYALIGAFLPVGSAALALAYKAVSTLDSMIGYRTAPYTDLGWFSAKTDDVLTYLPCRLTVFTIGLLSDQPLRIWQVCLRDAPLDPSPNSGWSECVYAATLGVQVGGMNIYKGVVKQKPVLGDDLQPITPERIRAALRLTRSCFLIWLLIGLMSLMLLNGIPTI